MHRVSDGQRRRVQLLLGLVRPFDILLLDEVTTCLDVIVRQDLLRWLQRETETRGATVLYATHIFDGQEPARRFLGGELAVVSATSVEARCPLLGGLRDERRNEMGRP